MHEITGDTLTVARSDTWLRRSVTWLRTRVEKHSILKLGFPTWPTLGAVFSSCFPWRKPMSSNQLHPAMNAAQGGILGAIGAQNAGLTITQAQLAQQQMAYNNAIMSANPPVMLREEARARRRLHVSVEVVANGFVLEAGADRLIAKTIEELQQHFVAQVAGQMLEDK